MNKLLAIFLVLLLTLAASACSVHKLDVQQGNVITQEMLEKLTTGMEKRQVKLLLGTPLIQDPFHKGRWDYIYSFQAGNSDEKQFAYLSLDFDGDKLVKIDVRKQPPKEADIKKPELSRK
jgi:outer membrane protein assembly factor BamE